MLVNGNGVPMPIAGLTQFTPAIPKLYWDVDSQEQGIRQLWKVVKKLCEYADEICDQTNLNTEDIRKLYETFKDFVEHGFEKYYEQQLKQWFLDNAWKIYDRIAKQVYFGLTDDGYFCAYVPESWGEIQFDTGAVFGRSDYGRLCLKFQPDPAAQGVIDNTYSYSLNDWNITDDMLAKVDKLIADLEVNSKRTDSTFDTLYTNLDSPVAAAQGRKQTPKSLTRDGENI